MKEWGGERRRDAADGGRGIQQVNTVGNWAYFSGAALVTRVEQVPRSCPNQGVRELGCLMHRSHCLLVEGCTLEHVNSPVLLI